MRARQFITESTFDPMIRLELEKKGYEFLNNGVDQMVFLEPGTGMILKIFGTRNGSTPTAYTPAQKTFILFANYCLANQDNQFLPHFEDWEPFVFQHGPQEPQVRKPAWTGTKPSRNSSRADNTRNTDFSDRKVRSDSQASDLSDFSNRKVRSGSPAAPVHYYTAGNKAEHMYLQIRMERLFEFDNGWNHKLDEMVGWARQSKSESYKDRFIEKYLAYGDHNSVSSSLFSHLGAEGFNQLWDTIYDLGKVADSNNCKLDLHGGNFMLGSDGHIVISDPFFSGWEDQ